jgi:Na+-driven multidrug efflux pump
MMKFSTAFAWWFVVPIAVLLVAAILFGPWWTVLLLALDEVCACLFWWVFSRPMWPKEPRYRKEPRC